MIRGRARGRRRLVTLFVLVLPPGRQKNWILNLFPGVRIHSSAIVERAVIINTERITLGPRAHIGNLNVIRGLIELRMEAGAIIGSLNTISSAAAFNSLPDDGRRGRLSLGEEAAVTNRHYLDCSGGVSIGRLSTVAGCRSTILTHQIDLVLNQQVLAPVEIGERCFVSSNVAVVPGSTIADRVVVAMGAVVKGALDLVGELYGGVPAKALGRANNGGYADRSKGPVEPG